MAVSQPSWLTFKTPKFRDMPWWRSVLILSIKSCSIGTDAGLIEKGCHVRAQGCGTRASRPGRHCQVELPSADGYVSILSGGGGKWCLLSLCPQRGFFENATSHRCLLSCTPLWSLRVPQVSPIPRLPDFSPEVEQQPQGFISAKPAEFQNSSL